MIDVCVGQNDEAQFLGREGKGLDIEFLDGFVALIEPAVDQKSRFVVLHEGARASDSSGRATESQFRHFHRPLYFLGPSS